MNTKLTLSLDEQIIARAKKFASKNNQSLSSLVENYFQSLISTSINNVSERNKLKAPITNSLRGVAKKLIIKNNKDFVTQELLKKYRIHEKDIS